MARERVLITGAHGYLASLAQLYNAGAYDFIRVSHSDVDFADPKRVAERFRKADFDICLHMAADATTAHCEKDSEGTHRVNTESAIEIARVCQERGKRLVFISTEQCFNAAPGQAPYCETDEMGTVSRYGQQKAEAAIKGGKFKDEIVPVEVPQRKGDPIVFDTDEHPKFGSTIEKMAKLKPAFKKDGGIVTAANASGINDSGAAVVVMSADKAKELGLKPLVKIVSYASAGVDPKIMGVGPVPASKKALEKAGLSIADMDLYEANEAFAAQSVAVGKELGFDPEKLNVNGGAIALGHPIGASGCRILITLIYEMLRRDDANKGLATLCIGGGMGTAVVVEKC